MAVHCVFTWPANMSLLARYAFKLQLFHQLHSECGQKALVFKDFNEFLKAGAFFFYQIQRGVENDEGKENVKEFIQKIMKTESGKRLAHAVFCL